MHSNTLRNDGTIQCLRSYGAVNDYEFFAVCIETFYENPQAFKNEIPQLYEHLKIMLNFDPILHKRVTELE